MFSTQCTSHPLPGRKQRASRWYVSVNTNYNNDDSSSLHQRRLRPATAVRRTSRHPRRLRRGRQFPPTAAPLRRPGAAQLPAEEGAAPSANRLALCSGRPVPFYFGADSECGGKEWWCRQIQMRGSFGRRPWYRFFSLEKKRGLHCGALLSYTCVG